jgi:hypothetical protein
MGNKLGVLKSKCVVIIIIIIIIIAVVFVLTVITTKPTERGQQSSFFKSCKLNHYVCPPNI